MMTRLPVIPPTISDQLRLWELERNRLRFSEGVLYSGFMSGADFERVREFSAEMDGGLLWENAERRQMVVDAQAHEAVRKFWKSQKKGWE